MSVADLDPSELYTEETAIIGCCQRKCVQSETKAEKSGLVVMKSTIYNLQPFLDSEGLLRVDDRLQQALIFVQAEGP